MNLDTQPNALKQWEKPTLQLIATGHINGGTSVGYHELTLMPGVFKSMPTVHSPGGVRLPANHFDFYVS